MNTSRKASLSAPDMLDRARAAAGRREKALALELYRELIARYPGYPLGWFELSGAESGSGQALSAIRSARRSIELAPEQILYRAHLAQLEVAYGLWGDALSTLAPLRTRRADDFEPRIANSIGGVLSLVGREDQAQAWFESAATRAPHESKYRYNVAQGLVHCGRIEESIHEFERLLRLSPDSGKVHWSLASIAPRRTDPARLEALRTALSRATSPRDEVFYRFALFRILDAMGRPREAFAELDRGMQLQRASTRYQGEDVTVMRRLGEAAGRLGRTSGASIPATQRGQARPLFIVGLPRSGTTVVERILCNHPEVAQGGEFPCFSAALREALGIESPAVASQELAERLASSDLAFDEVGNRYLELTAFKHQGFTCFTDKLPFNFLLVPWIARALPDARIVHVTRDPMDTCFSNLKQLFTRHYAACYSQRDIAEYYLAYRELMHAWDNLLPGRIMQVAYEDLVSDPETLSARMFDFCGLQPRQDAWRIEQNLKPVSTASAVQVRDPIDRRGIGAWRRYEAELTVLSDCFRPRPTELADGRDIDSRSAADTAAVIDPADPGWFPLDYNGRKDTFVFAKVTLDALGSAAFLDRRFTAHTHSIVEYPARELSAPSPRAPSFLFHTAFCGSTLLARALHAPPSAVALKEPQALLSLAMLPPELRVLADARLRSTLFLLARPWSEHGRVLVKPTNQANNLIAPILAACPASRAILLYSSLEEFLLSCFKKLPEAETRVQWMAQHLIAGTRLANNLGISPRQSFNLVESCVLTWFAQMELYANALAADGGDRLRTLDMHAMLASPETCVRACSRWLQLDEGEDVAARVAAVFSRDAKFEGREYDASRRESDKARIQARFGPMIAQALQWAQTQVAPAATLPANWKPLLGNP